MVVAQGENKLLDFAGKIFGRVKQQDGTSEILTKAAYTDATTLKSEAGKTVEPESLQQIVDMGVTPVIGDQIHAQVAQQDGKSEILTKGTYRSAANMKTEAGNVVAPEPLQDLVESRVTPVVANQVVNQVGEKNTDVDSLNRKYPAGGRMMDAADQATIINRDSATQQVSERLQHGLSNAQEDSFRSGKWEKLALQKVAEESKLFSPEALATVKSVITDLLESSIRTGINWGDRKGALDKLLLVQSTGLINDEDVSRIRSEYLLRDSLIDAGV